MSTSTAPSANSAGTAQAPPFKASRLQEFVLLTVLGADVMDLLDSTIVNVGAPSIARDLHASSSRRNG